MNLFYKRKKEKDRASEFALYISHDPFTVEMSVSFFETVLRLFISGVKEMHLMRVKHLALNSINSELSVVFTMDDTGRIVADVDVFAGTKGLLRFSFDFDQSFLPDII